MAQERNSTNEALIDDEFSGHGYAVGRSISRIFHPITLNIIMILIVGYFALESPGIGLIWAGLCLLIQVVPPTLFYMVRARQGAFSDEDVSVRQQRNELYLFGLITILVDVVILTLLGAPHVFLALMACGLVLGFIGGLINLFWKISIHAASVASTATVALLFSTRLGVALWLCAAAVGWARVRTRNHTPLQVLAGFGLAVSTVLIVFQIVR